MGTDARAASASRRGRLSGPVASCLVAAALFGVTTPASKVLLDGLGPVLLSGILYMGAALAVAPWALRDARASLRAADRANVVRLSGAVIFGGIVGPVLLLTGLAAAPAGSVSLWLNLETVFTAVLAWVFFREHMGARTLVAVGLIVAGSVLLSPTEPGTGIAAWLVAAACVAWGLDNNFTAVIDRFTPAQVTFAKGIVAGTLDTAVGLAYADSSPETVRLLGALGIGAVGYGVSLLLYIGAAQHLGATRSQLVFSTAPAWGLVGAWVAVREPVEPLQILAAALMGLAIWLWHREGHSHRHVHEAITHRHRHRHDDGHHDHEHADGAAGGLWHSHEHTHAPIEHEHPHRPDLHHRHSH